MESFKLKNLTFTYPGRTSAALNNINLSVKSGEFITLCGKSGCGKTTLLRLLKPVLSPHGDMTGSILFSGMPLSSLDALRQVSDIGFVMQSPDNQIVTDKVWHELAFGLESLGFSTSEIRTRVSEMASFFGISTWFHNKTSELSGGQKQILNLASVMVMQPSVLLLDEPTSQLDPIAASEFLNTLKKINRELGTTVILTEHRLEEAFPISDRVAVMDDGKIIVDETPQKVEKILKSLNHDMYFALPAPMRVHGALDPLSNSPLTVREGKEWLEQYSAEHTANANFIQKRSLNTDNTQTAVELRDVWFRYDKSLPDVIKGLSVKIFKGEFFAILGGNGTGKSTALSLMSGLNTPYRGSVLINGAKASKIKDMHLGTIGVLPQNPQVLFTKKTVYLDLLEVLSEKKLSKDNKEKLIQNISKLCRIENLTNMHPYDLSGGEQQRAALAKILLLRPKILILDEPTKGLDAHFKHIFADIIEELKSGGTTVIMVSHDIDFCAANADRCAMFFDGNITSVDTPFKFFAGKSFYTTAANRMARKVLPEAILAEDIVDSFRGVKETKQDIRKTSPAAVAGENDATPKEHTNSLTLPRIAAGCIFLSLFIALCSLRAFGILKLHINIVQILAAGLFGGTFICFFPQKEMGISVQQPKTDRRLTKRTLTAALLILIAIPFTLYIGMYYFGDRKYYFISLLIIIETLIPFCMVFENRKPQAREIVVISVMCAIGAVGRTAFFMLPQFKPVMALIIISGICFGGECGFLVGAVTAFVSNFFFGQGPWTPWQMFVWGVVGFTAGIFFSKGIVRKTKASLSVFGFFVTLIIYGGIMNPASVLMYQANPTKEMIAAAYITGIPFDIIHAAATAFFLWFISEPMIDKLERIKVKYGLIK